MFNMHKFAVVTDKDTVREDWLGVLNGQREVAIGTEIIPRFVEQFLDDCAFVGVDLRGLTLGHAGMGAVLWLSVHVFGFNHCCEHRL